MPVDPTPPEDPAPEALGIGAGNPDLAPGPQQAAHLGQHGHRVRGVLQNIAQDHHLIRRHRLKLLQGPGVHRKTPLPGQGRGRLVDLQTFRLKAVGGIEAQAPALVAAQVQQPAPAPRQVKRDIPVPLQPEAIHARGQKPLPPGLVSAARLHPGVIKSLVQRLQFRLGGPGPGLLQAATGALHDVIGPRGPETVVNQPGHD